MVHLCCVASWFYSCFLLEAGCDLEMSFLLCRSGFGHMVIQMRLSYADGSWLLSILSGTAGGWGGRGKAVRFSRQGKEPEAAVDPD